MEALSFLTFKVRGKREEGRGENLFIRTSNLRIRGPSF